MKEDSVVILDGTRDPSKVDVSLSVLEDVSVVIIAIVGITD